VSEMLLHVTIEAGVGHIVLKIEEAE